MKKSVATSGNENDCCKSTNNSDIEFVTIGEGLLILSPPNYQLIEHSNRFDAIVGGTEANVAIALENLGVNTGWVSKLPNNPMGRRLINVIKGYDVDVSRVMWTDKGRTGLLFVELGSEPRPTKSWYDRTNSASSTLCPEEVDWDYIRRAKLIHLTGITAALSKTNLATVKKAVEVAQEAKMVTTFDVNYRRLLWEPDRAKKTLESVIPNISVLITTLKDTDVVFGVDGTPEEVAKKLKKEFNLDIVVLTLGNNGSLAIADKTYTGRSYPIRIVNRMGAGDAFSAGFIYGYLKKKNVQAGLNYGGAMAALKHTIPTNISIFSVEDVESCMKGYEDIIR
ncbi:MAG: sugar kinase [Candidatus Ranarchaeia archaeon]